MRRVPVFVGDEERMGGEQPLRGEVAQADPFARVGIGDRVEHHLSLGVADEDQVDVIVAKRRLAEVRLRETLVAIVDVVGHLVPRRPVER